MSRIGTLLLVLAIAVAACTSTEAGEIVTSTTVGAPVTTLPPAGDTTTTVADGSTTTAPTTTTEPPMEFACDVSSITSVEGYTQGCDVLGMPILAAAEVEPAAIEAQAERVFEMLRARPDLATAVTDAALEGRVIGADQRITDLPEYEDLYDQYPGTDWRRVGRSFPGTELLPTFAGGEENLLCLDGDRYEGEDDFVRSFALTIRRFGLDAVDPTTSRAITQAYGRAIAQGLWTNTLAEINDDEYWMEGTQSYFDANLEDTSEDRPPNSSHNAIDTRDELRDYDPSLWAILASVYGDAEWRPGCP